MSPNAWEECFLLHQRSYGETSIIAEVFTRNLGKMSIIARGAKKPKSKFFGYLVPFSRLKITFLFGFILTERKNPLNTSALMVLVIR